MFDGSFKSTRKVNLSGRKSPAAGHKEDLVLQARRAREQRQEQKRRAAASTKLQALFRRVTASRRARSLVFQRLEAELTQLVASTDIRAEPVPSTEVERLLRQFLFVVPSRRKRSAVVGSPERLANVQMYLIVMLLVSCLRGSREQGTNVLLVAMKGPSWVYQSARVLELALEQVAQLDLASPTVDSNPYLVLLTLFTSSSNYSGADDTAAYAAMMSRLAVNASYGTFDALSAVITRCRRSVSGSSSTISAEELSRTSRVVQAIAVASAETLRLCRDDEKTLSPRQRQEIVAAFAHTVMLTPEASKSPIILKHTLPNATEEDATELWGLVLASFASLEQQHAKELSWRDRAVLIGNTVELITLHDFDARLVRSSVAVLARYISASLARWAFDVADGKNTLDAEASLAPPEDDDVVMFDDDNFHLHDDSRLQVAMAYLSNTLSDHDSLEMRDGIAALDPDERAAVRAQWQPLCFSEFFAKSFAILVTGDGDGDTPASDERVLDVCHVATSVLLSTGRSHVLSVETTFASPAPPVFAMLSALSVEDRGTASSNPIRRLWQWIAAHANAYRSANGSNSVDILTSKARLLEALVVFNVVFSHTLLGLDDETFYDRSWPLPASEVASVVAFLNRFLFEWIWSNTTNSNSTGSMSAAASSAPNEKELALFAAVTTSVKLFNQLYDRDSRRAFTPDGAWLWPSMPAIKETVDFTAMSEDSTTQGAAALFLLLKGLASASASSSSYSRMALVLATIPQVLSFNDRVQLFQKLLDEDKQSLRNIRDEFSRALKVRVKRDTIVDDSYEFFSEVCGSASTATPLKSRIKVTFVNEQGLEEAGIDGGGVFKEFVDQLTKHAFSPEYGFFLATDDEHQLLYPNPAVETFVVDSRREVIDRFRFLGRVLAKAVYENILVEPQFAAFFLNKLLGKFNYIDDLQSLDPALYRSLMSLKHIDNEHELADLALTFSVTERAFGRVVTRDLVPNGANIPVTNANKIRYMHVLANYKLNVQSSMESASFLRGFRDLIPAPWIQMFSPAELQMLIGGSATKIDVDDWERHTTYGGGYHPSQPTIQWFWSLVRDEFSPADRAALLKFITSCSRQPLLGFGQLAPQICVHQVRVQDDDRLPSSATCMNLLKLPTYSSKDAMRRKLLYAIRANAGFDLS